MKIIPCILTVIFFVSSCAVHTTFPFICFRSGCVSNALQLPAIKKQIDVKLKQKQRARNLKRNKLERTKNLLRSTDFNNDTTAAATGIRVDYTKYMLLFSFYSDTTKKDTLIIFHTSEIKSITETDQVRLKEYIRQKKPWEIMQVTIQKVLIQGYVIFEDENINRHKMRSIKKFIHEYGGLSYSKIVFTSTAKE